MDQYRFSKKRFSLSFTHFGDSYFRFCVSADSKGLSNPGEVEALREKVYASLEAYCKQKYPEQPGRWDDPKRHCKGLCGGLQGLRVCYLFPKKPLQSWVTKITKYDTTSFFCNRIITNRWKLRVVAGSASITVSLFCVRQVCQAVAAVTGAALHRPQVSGALVLL